MITERPIKYGDVCIVEKETRVALARKILVLIKQELAEEAFMAPVIEDILDEVKEIITYSNLHLNSKYFNEP